MSVLAWFDDSLRDCADVFEYMDGTKQLALIGDLVSSLLGKSIPDDTLHDIDISYCEEVSSDAVEARRRLNDAVNSSLSDSEVLLPSFVLDLVFSVSSLYPLEADQVRGSYCSCLVTIVN